MLQSQKESLLIITEMSTPVYDKRGEIDGLMYYYLTFAEVRTLSSGKTVAKLGGETRTRKYVQEFKWNEGQTVPKSQHWTKNQEPEVAKQYVNEIMEGEIITETVVPYMIGDKEVNTFTAVVLKSEDKVKIFKSLGHPIIGSETLKAFQDRDNINIAQSEIEKVSTKSKEVAESPFA